MTVCKSAKVINGTIHVGDKVINVPKCYGDRAFYGTVKEIVKMGVGCTWVIINTSKGVIKYPARLLNKGTYARTAYGGA